MLGVDVGATQKADRLNSGDPSMTHAMVFTGTGTDNQRSATKFRVESFDRRTQSESSVITQEWFAENVYKIVVDKRFLSAAQLHVLSTDLTTLQAWDVMGNLVN